MWDQNEWNDDCSPQPTASSFFFDLTQNTDLTFYQAGLLPTVSCSQLYCGEGWAGDGPDHPGARLGQVGDGARDGPGEVTIGRWQWPGSLQASWQINRRCVSQCPLSQSRLNEVRVSSLHLQRKIRCIRSMIIGCEAPKNILCTDLHNNSRGDCWRVTEIS